MCRRRRHELRDQLSDHERRITRLEFRIWAAVAVVSLLALLAPWLSRIIAGPP